MRKVAFVLAVSALLGACSHSSGLWGNDEFERYTARVDAVTMDAGDGNRRNIAMQTDNPYPRGAYDHSIPVSAAKMARAVQCYEGSRPITGVQTDSKSVGVAAGGVAIGASQSSSKPVNDC